MGREIIVAIVLIVSVGLAQAGTRADLSGDAVVDFQTTMDMPFMTVGNPGYGGVDYEYSIGKFEVTAGQYTEFLNAVAATDPYGLYNPWMDVDPWEDRYGCEILRHGASGSYTYTVAADYEDRPVTFVGWGDAARFANWLTNGMPTGAQDLTTTEDGSYVLDGATSDEGLAAVTRKSPTGWGQYVIPSGGEWHKAAYYDGASDLYFDYPTSSDTEPSNTFVDPDPGNHANIEGTIGSPYWTTEAGEFENSPSPYGTFDQAGNIWEWSEHATTTMNHRYLYGGAFGTDWGPKAGQYWLSYHTDEYYDYGFRIAEVPEPATLSLLALGACLPLFRRKRR